VAATAKKGPNAKQIASLVRLFRDCRRRYPRIKPLGHRDQQNVKPCPGSTPAMRAAFRGMGGHGADYKLVKPTPPILPPVVTPPTGPLCHDQLAAAQRRIANLEEQVEAMQAAIAGAVDLLDDVAVE